MCAALMTRKANPKKPSAPSRPEGPLGAAQEALARGDVQRARALYAEAASSGSPEQQAEARARLGQLGLDPGALAAAGAVLAAILFAVVSAILLRR